MARIIDPALDKARAYLASQNLHNELRPREPSEGPYVTISRESGTGAPAFAQALAARLAADDPAGQIWSIFGSNLIEAVLQEHQLSPRLAAFLPEGRVPELRALIGEIVGLHPNLWDLVQKTNRLIRQLADHGRVILIGRGAAFATKGIRNGLHLRLIAPDDFRARHTAQRLGLSDEAAAAHNQKLDASRRSYVKANFDAEGPDPKAYDLVINVAEIPPSEAVEMVVPLIHARTPALRSAPTSENVSGLAQGL